MNYKLCDVCDHAISQQLHIVKRTGSNEKRWGLTFHKNVGNYGWTKLLTQVFVYTMCNLSGKQEIRPNSYPNAYGLL